MTHEEFMDRISRPMFVWRMANAIVRINERAGVIRSDSPALNSAPARMENSQRDIDNAVLERAAEIRRERND